MTNKYKCCDTSRRNKAVAEVILILLREAFKKQALRKFSEAAEDKWGLEFEAMCNDLSMSTTIEFSL